MIKSSDEVSSLILKLIEEADEPLESKEIHEKMQKVSKRYTRAIIFYRLTMLRGDQKINGKFVGPGKGVWIWWKIKFNK